MYVALTRARERLILSGAVAVDPWPGSGPGAPALAWLGPALLGGDPAERLPGPREEWRDVAWELDGFAARVRCRVNRPAGIGRVLRRESLAPAGGALEPAPAPRPLPPAPDAAPAPPAVRTLSYSALASWRACGYRFYLQRILNLPEERVGPPVGAPAPPAGLEARLRGSIVHALMEEQDFTAAPVAPVPGAVAAAGARFGVALSDEDVRDIAGLVEAFARSALRARLAAATAVRREESFAFGLGEALLTGVVDVIADEPGGRLVVDYKSDRVEDATDLEALVEEDYGVQRRIYALAALRGGAARVEVVHVFLQRPDEPATATYTSADRGGLEADLLELAAGALTGRYTVSDEPHRDLCETCPGRRALCSHPEELTLRERPPAEGYARSTARAAGSGAETAP